MRDEFLCADRRRVVSLREYSEILVLFGEGQRVFNATVRQHAGRRYEVDCGVDDFPASVFVQTIAEQ